MHDLVRRGRRPGVGGLPGVRRSMSRTGSSTRRVLVPVRPRPRPLLLLVALGGMALLVAGVTLAVSGGGPEASEAGLPTAGLLTGWGLPAVRVLANLAAVGCVGALRR